MEPHSQPVDESIQKDEEAKTSDPRLPTEDEDPPEEPVQPEP